MNNHLTGLLLAVKPHTGLLAFGTLIGLAFTIDKSTAQYEIVPCKFDVGYKTKGGKGGSSYIGECWTNELGTVKANLKGVGLTPRKGTWVELTIMRSALRTYYEIDVASRVKPPTE